VGDGPGKPASRGQDIGGEATPGIDHQLRAVRFGSGFPGHGHPDPGVGLEVQHDAKQLDAGDAVDHAVVDLED
jgi:hypothetical protein